MSWPRNVRLHGLFELFDYGLAPGPLLLRLFVFNRVSFSGIQSAIVPGLLDLFACFHYNSASWSISFYRRVDGIRDTGHIDILSLCQLALLHIIKIQYIVAVTLIERLKDLAFTFLEMKLLLELSCLAFIS